MLKGKKTKQNQQTGVKDLEMDWTGPTYFNP